MSAKLEESTETNSTWHTITIKILFVSAHHAAIAKQVVEVDPELQASVVKRDLATMDETLVATFTCLTVRLARLSANSFLDNIELIIRTLGEFGTEAV